MSLGFADCASALRLATAASVVISPLLAWHAAHANSPPTVGIYQTYQYVTDSSSKPNGLTGCNSVGTVLGGYFSYPGPLKTGAQSFGAAEQTTTMRMLICDYPATPAVGATVWSGSEQCTDTYLSGSPKTYTLTFDAKIVYVSKSSWLEQRTITYPVTGGTCTEKRNVGLVRTGK